MATLLLRLPAGFTLCTALLVVVAPSNALAQSQRSMAKAEILDEVVVTARKRSETMMDVPISINVVSEETIERLGAEDFTDLLS